MLITESQALEIRDKTHRYYVKSRLYEWGRWCRNDDLRELGYGQSVIAKMMKSSGVFIDNTKDFDVNPEAEEIDGLVCTLGESRSKQVLVLRDRYIAMRSYEIISQKRSLPLRTIKEWHANAIRWVGEKLNKNV